MKGGGKETQVRQYILLISVPHYYNGTLLSISLSLEDSWFLLSLTWFCFTLGKVGKSPASGGMLKVSARGARGNDGMWKVTGSLNSQRKGGCERGADLAHTLLKHNNENTCITESPGRALKSVLRVGEPEDGAVGQTGAEGLWSSPG